LDALARLPVGERQELIQRAVAGEVVSARPISEPHIGPAAGQEIDSPLTMNEWATLGGFLRRIIAAYHADCAGDYSSVELAQIARFDEIHGARIFAQEALESRLSYWAFDVWQHEFREFKKVEAKAARKRGTRR
jgi:hypothetical protein